MCGCYYAHFRSAISKNHLVEIFNHFCSNHVCRAAWALLLKNGCTATVKFVEPISHGCHRWRRVPCRQNPTSLLCHRTFFHPKIKSELRIDIFLIPLYRKTPKTLNTNGSGRANLMHRWWAISNKRRVQLCIRRFCNDNDKERKSIYMHPISRYHLFLLYTDRNLMVESTIFDSKPESLGSSAS